MPVQLDYKLELFLEFVVCSGLALAVVIKLLSLSQDEKNTQSLLCVVVPLTRDVSPRLVTEGGRAEVEATDY